MGGRCSAGRMESPRLTLNIEQSALNPRSYSILIRVDTSHLESEFLRDPAEDGALPGAVNVQPAAVPRPDGGAVLELVPVRLTVQPTTLFKYDESESSIWVL